MTVLPNNGSVLLVDDYLEDTAPDVELCHECGRDELHCIKCPHCFLHKCDCPYDYEDYGTSGNY